MPIPEEAMAVVEILRRDVPRPKTLPFLVDDDCCLRWWGERGAFIDKVKIIEFHEELENQGESDIVIGQEFCPMGLHKDSSNPLPVSGPQFDGGVCSTGEVEAFYEWWDRQKDAETAMNEVWPLKGEKE